MSARARIAMLAVLWIGVGGCFRSGGSPMGVPLRDVTQFESEWSTYKRLAPRKALAVAGDLNGVYASGFAFAYPFQALASDAALERCEERRVDRRIAGECKLYAIGDDLAGEAAPK